MSSNGYRQKEPYDDVVQYKHPVVFKQAIKLLLEDGNMTIEGIMNLFHVNNFSLSAELIEDLLNLDKGTLTNVLPNEDNIIKFASLYKT